MKSLQKIKKYMPVGALGISLVIHLLIFFAISGIVIIKAIQPKQPFEAAPPVMDLPAEPPPVEDNQPTPDTTPQDTTDPTPAAAAAPMPEVISANVPVAPVFTMQAPTVGTAMGSGFGSASSGSGSGKGSGLGGKIIINPFGSSDPMSGGLEGYFFDLKQTKNGEPTHMDQGRWQGILTKFVKSNWSLGSLKEFYQSPKPLFSHQWLIPTSESSDGPKAFGLPNVKPSLWAIVYSGRVKAPEDGQYTFCGYGDDLLIVRINGEIVLDAGWLPITTSLDKLHTYPDEWSKRYKQSGLLRIGKTFQVKAGEPVNMQVLIGDRGGLCAFYLLIRKEGKQYGQLSDGTLKLPFFQIGQQEIRPKGECPPHSTESEAWQQ